MRTLLMRLAALLPAPAATVVAMLAALTAGVVAGPGSPAQALEGDGIIQDGEFVVWQDCDFRGLFYDFAHDHKDYRGVTYREEAGGEESDGDAPPDKVPVDDSASSVANLSTVNSVNAYLFERYVGPRLVVLPKQRIDLCAKYPDFDDQLSSHHF